MLGEAVPEHQVLERRLLHQVTLRRLQVVHKREDALALRGIRWDEQRDCNEAQHEVVLAAEVDEHVRPEIVKLAQRQVPFIY